MMSVFREGVGLMRMWCVGWVTRQIHIFDLIGGWGKFHFGLGLDGFLIWQRIGGFQLHIWLFWVGMRVGRISGGDVVCWLERRSWLGSVALFLLTCRCGMT